MPKGWRFPRSEENDGTEGYHNFWWIEDASRGAFAALGHAGQVMYVDPDAEFAAVKLSYWPDDGQAGQRYSEFGSVVAPAIRAALSGS